MSYILRRGSRILFSNGGFSPSNLPFTFRLLSASPNKLKERPFVVSYLIHSCGLSPQSAKSVSKKVDFETPDGPDAVLCLFKDYGFTNSHISKLVGNAYKLLLADPAKTLLPKLEFLRSIGGSTSDVPDLVCLNPTLLTSSLQKCLVPVYDILRSVLVSDEEVFRSLRRSFRNTNNLLKRAPINIALLRELKVPQPMISYLLIYSPDVVCKDPDKFSENVNRVIEIGMDPSKKMFVQVLQVISQQSHKAWKQKIEVYKSLGLSEEHMFSAFKIAPYCMAKSAKKITSTMDFLVNKMGYQPADIVCCPTIFGYSLEQRIIPRFSVIRVLQLKGLVKENVSIASVMVINETRFLNNYVIRYERKLPELMSVYRGQKSIQELGLEFGAEKHLAG